MELDRYLEDLESRIDPAVEEDLLAQWRAFSGLELKTGDFRPARQKASAPKVQWPKVRINRTQDDCTAMALDQYGGCSATLGEPANGRAMMVRANYGTPILAMPFGVELFLMPEETNTLPAAKPLGTEGVRTFLAAEKKPSTSHPYLEKVYEMGRRYRDIGRRYPKIGKYVAVYHPDLQGPMDIVEVVWGSEVFTALVDEPELVHQLLEMVTELYIAVLRQWMEIVPLHFHGLAAHWGLLHRGGIMLRDDSAMNLSPGMFEEFVRPYDQRLLKEFGGGAIHACGKVDHFVEFLSQMPGLYAFNMSQPHLNNMEKVWRHTVDRDVVLIGFDNKVAETAIRNGRDLRGRVHAG